MISKKLPPGNAPLPGRSVALSAVENNGGPLGINQPPDTSATLIRGVWSRGRAAVVPHGNKLFQKFHYFCGPIKRRMEPIMRLLAGVTAPDNNRFTSHNQLQHGIHSICPESPNGGGEHGPGETDEISLSARFNRQNDNNVNKSFP